jgi:hypothetical protein
MLKKAALPPRMPGGSAFALKAPSMRAYELQEIKSLPIRDLFPDIPEAIYLYGDDVSIVRRHTEEALACVDMSMIKPDHRVNVLCSEHGFNIMGGLAYAEMLKTIKDVVQDRTGCTRIRLVFCCGIYRSEAKDILYTYKLAEHYEGQVEGCTPFDEGMPVETEIGTMYVLKQAFASNWFIHTHYDDPREIYFNRLIARTFKPFTMSYARFETRSLYHMSFGPRSSNIVPRVIFETPIIRDKHAFTIELVTSPTGLLGVAADNDIRRLDRKGIINTLKSYGKIFSLLRTIDEVIVVADAARPIWYGHCGGVVAGIVLKSHMDLLDLDVAPKVSEQLTNPAVKAMVINHTSPGLYCELPFTMPVFIADKVAASQQKHDVLPYSTIAESLPHAMDLAYKAAKTDKVMVFDGNYGSFNLSSSMGEYLIEKAPEAGRIVEETLLSKWLLQRGINPDEV